MAIYKAEDGSWVATQAEAKGCGGIALTFEVPSTKAGWLALLNMKTERQPEPSLPDEPVVAITRPEPARQPTRRTADGVMEWVLDGATNADIENLFRALGARFHEAQKVTR